MLWISAGCAHSKRAPASEPPRYAHVLRKPLAEALAATHQLLEAQGYAFEETEDPHQRVTTWSEPDRAGSRSARPTVAARPGLSPYRQCRAPSATEGLQGLLYVGKLTPSLPAVLGPRAAPPSDPGQAPRMPGRRQPLPGVF